MIREIKFRAKSLSGELVCFELYEILNYYPGDEVFYVGNIPFAVGSERQYTGLNDKNGKEIYEGDIVKHRRRKYQVCWNSMGWGSWGMKDRTELMCNRIYLGELEVIGNIYENQELLKVED